MGSIGVHFDVLAEARQVEGDFASGHITPQTHQGLIDPIELLCSVVVYEDVQASELSEFRLAVTGKFHVFGKELVKAVCAVPVAVFNDSLFAIFVVGVGYVIVLFVADIAVLFVNDEGNTLTQFLVFQILLPFSRNACSLFVYRIIEKVGHKIHDIGHFEGSDNIVFSQVFEGVLSLSGIRDDGHQSQCCSGQNKSSCFHFVYCFRLYNI